MQNIENNVKYEYGEDNKIFSCCYNGCENIVLVPHQIFVVVAVHSCSVQFISFHGLKYVHLKVLLKKIFKPLSFFSEGISMEFSIYLFL